jgi:V8-like Glu-specific endopeptidase
MAQIQKGPRVQLTPEQRLELHYALVNAVPDYLSLSLLLLEIKLDIRDFGTQLTPVPQLVYNVLNTTEAYNLTVRLIEALKRNRPNNSEFVDLAAEVGIGLPAEVDNLEKLLDPQNLLFDAVEFRNQLSTIEGQVCRIDINGKAAGTGFLIGPAAVLTNYHVIEPIAKGTAGYSASKVELLFDFKMLNKTTIHEGTKYKLAKEWLIDSSPYSTIDSEPEDKKTSAPSLDELDYAVLRADGKLAEKPLGLAPDPVQPAVRGFISLPEVGVVPDFAANKVLFIVQHPRGQPLKITTNTFRSLSDPPTRLTYLNDTLDGSSGSPCFNANWELVALHHSGDPSFKSPKYNEGIPMHMIVDLLNQRDKLGEILE